MKKLPIFSILFTALFLSFLVFLNFSQVQAETAVTITNPSKWDTLEKLADAIIDFLWKIALALASLMIVIAGYYFVTAAGDPKQVTTAKKIILYTLIGLAIIFISKGIVKVIEGIIKG